MIENEIVKEFQEKPALSDYRINGGFFILQPEVFEFIEGDSTIWEDEPLKRLASTGELMSFNHDGFWQPMDTLRDKRVLQEMWERGDAPWKVW